MNETNGTPETKLNAEVAGRVNALVMCFIKTDELMSLQSFIDIYYKSQGACCAGCDWWRYHNSIVGDCIKSAPVSGLERTSMLDMDGVSLVIPAGHIMTKRDHICGDFIDSHDWSNDT